MFNASRARKSFVLQIGHKHKKWIGCADRPRVLLLSQYRFVPSISTGCANVSSFFTEGDLRRGKRLGKQDRLMSWSRESRNKYWSKRDWLALSNTLEVRVCRFQIKQNGMRTQTLWIATTLTDPKLYLKQTLAELYQCRWQVELFLRDIKRSMKPLA